MALYNLPPMPPSAVALRAGVTSETQTGATGARRLAGRWRRARAPRAMPRQPRRRGVGAWCAGAAARGPCCASAAPKRDDKKGHTGRVLPARESAQVLGRPLCGRARVCKVRRPLKATCARMDGTWRSTGMAAWQSSMPGSKRRTRPSSTLMAMATVTSCSFKRTWAWQTPRRNTDRGGGVQPHTTTRKK